MTNYDSLLWNIASGLIVFIFCVVFGIPDTAAIQVVASLYALLMFCVLICAVTDRRLPAFEGRILVAANLILFVAAYSTFTQILALPKDSAYALALLVSLVASVQMVCAYALVARRQLTRGFVGHAAHAVCLKQEGERLYTFVIFNKNHNLWLLPGGHMDIVNDEPFVVARHRILSELGYDSVVLESHHFDKCEFANIQILNGCHAFYRITLGMDKCHSLHFDFSYVCILTKRVQTEAKYESIRVDVTECANAESVAAKLREAIFRYYSDKQISIPREAFPPDLADRIHLGLDHYHKHIASNGGVLRQ